MSTHNNFTLPQIEAELEKLNYNVLTLKDSNGLKILNQNSPKTTRLQQLEKIRGLLASRACPDGPYIIEAVPQLKSLQRPLTFTIWKGGEQKQNRQQLSEREDAMTKPILPAEIFALYSENATLKGDNDSLRRQLLQAEAREERNLEIIEELRGANQTLSEGATKGPSLMEGITQNAQHIPAIIGAIRDLISPAPAPMAQQPPQTDPKLIAAINALSQGQKLLLDRLVAVEESLQEEDEALTAEELYTGVQNGEFSPEDAQQYLNENPHLKEEYESYGKQEQQ